MEIFFLLLEDNLLGLFYCRNFIIHYSHNIFTVDHIVFKRNIPIVYFDTESDALSRAISIKSNRISKKKSLTYLLLTRNCTSSPPGHLPVYSSNPLPSVLCSLSATAAVTPACESAVSLSLLHCPPLSHSPQSLPLRPDEKTRGSWCSYYSRRCPYHPGAGRNSVSLEHDGIGGMWVAGGEGGWATRSLCEECLAENHEGEAKYKMYY